MSGQRVGDAIEQAAARLGKTLGVHGAELRAYAAERVVHLATIAGQAGFEEALVAERDNMALKIGIATVDAADDSDRELLGVLLGALAVAAT